MSSQKPIFIFIVILTQLTLTQSIHAQSIQTAENLLCHAVKGNGTVHVCTDRFQLNAPHIHVTATEAFEVEVKWKIQNEENNSDNYSYLRS